jgi:hypothetical protein
MFSCVTTRRQFVLNIASLRTKLLVSLASKLVEDATISLPVRAPSIYSRGAFAEEGAARRMIFIAQHKEYFNSEKVL